MSKLIRFLLLFVLAITSINSSAQTISGSIRDPGGSPLGGNILLVNPSGDHVADFWTDHLGNFITHPLADGTYFAVTRLTGEMLDEAWDDFPCENMVCDIPASTPIVVSGGEVTGIDFVLMPLTQGGRMSGTLSGPGGPLPSGGVSILNRNYEHLFDMSIYPDGTFKTQLMANDDYYVHTLWEPLGLGSELFDDQPCLPHLCRDPAFIAANATVVTISDADRPDINFSLEVPPGLGMISGQVTDADIGIPLPGVHMNLLNALGHPLGFTDTDRDGNYYFSGLADGNYKAIAINVPEGYSGKLYDDVPCHEWSCNGETEGTVINISSANTVSDIDFSLNFVGTRILGTVTRSDTKEPVSSEFAHMAVDLFDENGDFINNWGTNRAGQYQIVLPGAGNYYLAAISDWGYHGLVNEAWDDIKCYGDCSPQSTGATLVPVADGSSVIADFELDPGFELSGNISIEGGPTDQGGVNIWDEDGNWVTHAGNHGGGGWVSVPLPPDTYYASVRGEDFGMVSQLYDGIACPQEFCDVTGGTPVVVTDTIVTGIDFDLSPVSADWTISGSIRDPGGNPLGGNVLLVGPFGNHVADFWMDHLGNFTTHPLADGTYFAVTRFTGNSLDEAWDDVPCENMVCDIPASTPIVVSGGDVTGIDFVLLPLTQGGRISGIVSGPGGPLSSGGVSVLNRNYEHLSDARVRPDGTYQTELLANDDYYLHTLWEPLGLGSELYDDQPCFPDSCRDPVFIAANATVVTVSDADRPNINFSLEVPSGLGMISGQVTDADIGIPLPGVHMNLLNVHGHHLGNTDTDRDGNFYFSGLEDGSYKVIAIGVPEGYSGKLYDDVPCHDWGCNTETEGSVIGISGANTVGDIDFSLDFVGTRILGTVTRSDTLEPVSSEFAHMAVDLFDENGDFLGGWPTNRAGQYQIVLPGAGNYYLAAINDRDYHGLINEAWENIRCYDNCNPSHTGATLVPVADGASVIADFELDPGFELSGNISIEGGPTHHGGVNIWDKDGRWVCHAGNNGGGGWASMPLPSGTYYASVRGEDFGMVSQLYDGLACPQEFCDVTGGTPIVVTDTAVAGIDFDLSPVSTDWTISGSIRDPAGNPLGGNILLVDPFGNHVADFWTDHMANFTTHPLADGTYFAVTRFTGNSLDEAWDDVPCENMVCDIPASTPIVVSGGDVTGIDFVLMPLTQGGRIYGMVSGPAGPLPSGGVSVLNRNFEHLFDLKIYPDGSYRTRLLANDDYYLHTLWEPLGMGSELFDDQTCLPQFCRDPAFVAANGTAVTISNANRHNINFSLEVPPGLGIISGQVTDADLGIRLPDVHMVLLNEHGHYERNTNTDHYGNYYFSGLDDGSYKVIAIGVPEGYSGKLYDDVSCHDWSCNTETEGSVIGISGASTVGDIDFSLDFVGTRILGTVTRSDTHKPVSGEFSHMAVDLFDENGDYIDNWRTNRAGQYQIVLPGAGNYYLSAISGGTYHRLVNEAWDNIRCYDNCSPLHTGATVVPVADGTSVIADFELDPYMMFGSGFEGSDPCDISGAWATEARDCTVEDCDDGSGRYLSWDGKVWCHALITQEWDDWTIDVPPAVTTFDFWIDWGALDGNDCGNGLSSISISECGLNEFISRDGEEKHLTCDVTGLSSLTIVKEKEPCDYVIIGDPYYY